MHSHVMLLWQGICFHTAGVYVWHCMEQVVKMFK